MNNNNNNNGIHSVFALYFVLLILVICLSLLPSAHAEERKTWFDPYVQEAAMLNLATENDIEFTNEQVLNDVLRLFDEEPYAENDLFSYAREKGYIKEKEMIDPTKPVTRQMLAKLISRVLQLPDGDASLDENITDWEDTCPYCKSSILSCYTVGIMSGYEDGSFRGRNSASGKEVVAVLVNAYRYRKGIS